MNASLRSGERGTTLVELVSVSAILIVLAALALPVANTMVKHRKELELRQALRSIRDAIDRFQLDAERYPGVKLKYINRVNEELFPEDLKHLYEGVDIGDATGTRLKYLRRLPRDPITGTTEWGTRSSRDSPESLFSDGVNIFDVHTLSDKKGLNGEPYREW
jgi:general secretion pathway protein G